MEGRVPPAAMLPPLDPLGSLIYYLCVAEGLKDGGLRVPSSGRVSTLLAIETVPGTLRARDARVQALWEDLQWLNRAGVLFHEQPYREDEFYRRLAQHNVNARMRQFRPGFESINPRTRRLVLGSMVEKTGTAARLVALKDLYHFNHSEVPHRFLRDFLTAERLVEDDNECYSFLESMHLLHFLDSYPPGAMVAPVNRQRHFLVEPTDFQRSLDMYLELRALDYASSIGNQSERREWRTELSAAAQAFCDNARDRQRPSNSNERG